MTCMLSLALDSCAKAVRLLRHLGLQMLAALQMPQRPRFSIGSLWSHGTCNEKGLFIPQVHRVCGPAQAGNAVSGWQVNWLDRGL